MCVLGVQCLESVRNALVSCGRTRRELPWKRCAAEPVRRRNVCLVDALRALGVHVPYVSDGPFKALSDGNEWLRPHGSFGMQAAVCDVFVTTLGDFDRL